MLVDYNNIENKSYTFFPTFVETFIDSYSIDLARELANTKIQYNNSDFWTWQNPLKNKVKKVISNCAKIVIDRHYDNNVNNILIGRSWINFHKKSEELTAHQHGNSLFVCTYYIQSNDDTGDLILIDPRGSMIVNNFKSKQSVISTNTVRVKAKNGGLIFFPGYLYHYVEKNITDIPRISISVNFRMKEQYNGFNIE